MGIYKDAATYNELSRHGRLEGIRYLVRILADTALPPPDCADCLAQALLSPVSCAGRPSVHVARVSACLPSLIAVQVVR